MFELLKRDKKEKRIISKPTYYSAASTAKTDKQLREYWSDNECVIPRFNSWDELFMFLRNEKVSLAAKLEVINNIEIPSNLYSNDGFAIPDFFWKYTYLDRRIRAACRRKSEHFLSVQGKDEDNVWYEKLLKYGDNDLFLGLCELATHPLFIFLNSSLLTQEQKETMVRCAINFENSYNRQSDYHEYTLIKAYESDSFSKEFKDEIYEVIKRNMLSTGNYAHQILTDFFTRFYNDETVSEEDKIKMINHSFSNNPNYDYTQRYMFYLGNKNIPSFIQRIVLNHFVKMTDQYSRALDATSYINMLINPELPDDSKVQLIDSTTSPVILCYALADSQVDERITELLKAKLETLVIPETKEVLEMMKALLSNPDISRKRLVPNLESSKQDN